jgi:mannose-6-phosphate isomerase-like protein (cupin superfamily)
MGNRQTRVGRRQFIHTVGLVSTGATLIPAATAEATQAEQPWTGAALQAADGLQIPPTPDGRKMNVKIDSQATPGVRMSMLTEDLPANTEIRVHLHEREDEIIFIRMGTGIATLGDREIQVGPGSTVYVPKGVWHGLRNNGPDLPDSSKARYNDCGGRTGRRPRSRRTGRSTASSTGHPEPRASRLHARAR